MASLARWKNSPCKPGIPELTYDDHVRMISKKPWQGQPWSPSTTEKEGTPSKRNNLNKNQKTSRYDRPEWLHHAIRYERDPFTRSFVYFYEERTTIDERVAKIWSTEAHQLEQKRARVRREHRAHLKRPHGHADLNLPHGLPEGPTLDPTWQHPSSLQYTPASGTSTAGANVLSRITEKRVDAVLQRIGIIGKKTQNSQLRKYNKNIRRGIGINGSSYDTKYKDSLKLLKSSNTYSKKNTNGLHMSDLKYKHMTNSPNNKIVLKKSQIITESTQTFDNSNKQNSNEITESIDVLKLSHPSTDVDRMYSLETKIKELETKLELEKKQHAKEIEDLKIEFGKKLEK
jgi:hypothetical protein